MSREGQTYHRDAREIIDSAANEMVNGMEWVERMAAGGVDRKGNSNLRGYGDWIAEEINVKMKKVDKLKREGKIEESDLLLDEIGKLQDSFSFAKEVVEMAKEGRRGVEIKPMTKPEALEFVNRYNEITLNDGTKITSKNYEIIRDKVDLGRHKVAQKIEDTALSYIVSSLRALGLIESGTTDINNRPIINKSVIYK